MITQQAFGLNITLAAVNGVTYQDFPTFLDAISEQFKDIANAEPENTAKKLQDATDQYVFLDDARRAR
jgi:hypothetical protein